MSCPDPHQPLQHFTDWTPKADTLQAGPGMAGDQDAWGPPWTLRPHDAAVSALAACINLQGPDSPPQPGMQTDAAHCWQQPRLLPGLRPLGRMCLT